MPGRPTNLHSPSSTPVPSQTIPPTITPSTPTRRSPHRNHVLSSPLCGQPAQCSPRPSGYYTTRVGTAAEFRLRTLFPPNYPIFFPHLLVRDQSSSNRVKECPTKQSTTAVRGRTAREAGSGELCHVSFCPLLFTPHTYTHDLSLVVESPLLEIAS